MIFSHLLTTSCVASPQAEMMESMGILELTNFMDFTELVKFAELAQLMEIRPNL